ncbi:fumarate/nitrate reduction transcriptional regulator Fnr [Kineobactrum salinum]|uniref:Fumarate/nitrate reduction transcriptional regulator Fnr n=1 Tax=Kineobactrum salinum TaxID=2708301 RepID=A0A6C0TXY5_9GAMM|nr:fumarate/nitrate reduction transcriptional regulator Fnr [Kineobactrum salinum]QIB64498.1 fumarate/nitrate reduction transcriptional regulator Fnr [Kineobactrum salinum]
MSTHPATLSVNEPFPPCHQEFQVSCHTCRLSRICLPLAVNSGDLARLESIIERSRPLQKGELLYREKTPFQSIYAVRSGALKGFCGTRDGKEQVTGFYLPGEVLGMDGISNGHHASSALALETSAICEIPFDSLQRLSASLPGLQRHLFQLMSREITEDQLLITLLGKNTAEERVATLLLSISRRNARRQLSASQFRLPMSRVDIGNYLGLTVETISRVFSRLQKNGVLRVDNKEIEILDPETLQRAANLAC